MEDEINAIHLVNYLKQDERMKNLLFGYKDKKVRGRELISAYIDSLISYSEYERDNGTLTPEKANFIKDFYEFTIKYIVIEMFEDLEFYRIILETFTDGFRTFFVRDNEEENEKKLQLFNEIIQGMVKIFE